MLFLRNDTSGAASLGLESWEYWNPHLIDARRLQRKMDALEKSKKLGVSALGSGGHNDSRFDIWCLLTSEIVKASDFLNDSTRETLSQATKNLITLSSMSTAFGFVEQQSAHETFDSDNILHDGETETILATGGQEHSKDAMNALACLCLSLDNMTRFELLNAAIAFHYASVVTNEGEDQGELWNHVVLRRINAVVDVQELSRIREALTSLIGILMPVDAEFNGSESLCGVCSHAVAVVKVTSDDVLHCVDCILEAFRQGKLSLQFGCDFESELQVLSLISGKRKLNTTSNLIVAMERFRKIEEKRSEAGRASCVRRGAVDIEESGNVPSSSGSNLKLGASCHQCKNHKKPYELVYCQSTGVYNEGNPSPNATSTTAQLRACNKKFCDKCLLRYYENTGTVDRHCWQCPACRGICNCAACKRHKRRKTNNSAVAIDPCPPLPTIRVVETETETAVAVKVDVEDNGEEVEADLNAERAMEASTGVDGDDGHNDETLIDADADAAMNGTQMIGAMLHEAEKADGIDSLWVLGQEESLSILGDSNDLNDGMDFLAWNNGMCA